LNLVKISGKSYQISKKIQKKIGWCYCQNLHHFFSRWYYLSDSFDIDNFKSLTWYTIEFKDVYSCYNTKFTRWMLNRPDVIGNGVQWYDVKVRLTYLKLLQIYKFKFSGLSWNFLCFKLYMIKVKEIFAINLCIRKFTTSNF
jgi:hypothetical protein